ncbi:MAG TPA: TetR/AcrR family transcriptional regulator [Candidatus Acidoferrales bacterium]|nr:TetR/AcrR family transcriptional regulator [Candidatus Acidoferrales bacterium]
MTTKTEKAASTKTKIIAVARRLFASRGYEGTSTEAVLDRSHVSRGALYHHFENKEALFAAVLEAVEVDITDATASVRANVTDPVEALQRGFNRFLELACETEVRQIVLIDAHSVLGWQKWREIEERYGLGRLKQALKLVAATGRIREDMVDVFAHILLASLIEVAFLVARSPDPRAAAKTGRKAIKEFLERVLAALPASQ